MSKSISEEESQQLDNCIHRIDEIIDRDTKWLDQENTSGSTFKEVNRVLREQKIDNLQNLESARPNPYFGRVDFIEGQTPGKADTYYFGKYHIPPAYVYSFTVPAAKLFYQPLAGGYNLSSGRREGKVILKRELTIEQARLLKVVDMISLLPAPTPIKKIGTRLHDDLSKSKGNELNDIVPTIQPQQYQIIASSLNQVLIIQGVAGSGKSVVGLHRIAFLLSPHNELDLKISLDKVIFFGPSGAFLDYIVKLLPGLGVESVKQMTVHQWMKNLLPGKPKIEKQDALLEKILTKPKSDVVLRINVAKYKSSMEMARLLEAYTEQIKNSFINNVKDISINQKVLINGRIVRSIFKSNQKLPLNKSRQAALSKIEQEINRGQLTKLNEKYTEEVTRQFNLIWPEINYKLAYADLVSNPDLLIKLSKKIISIDDALNFDISLKNKPSTIKIEDLPALCYFNYLIKWCFSFQWMAK